MSVFKIVYGKPYVEGHDTVLRKEEIEDLPQGPCPSCGRSGRIAPITWIDVFEPDEELITLRLPSGVRPCCFAIDDAVRAHRLNKARAELEHLDDARAALLAKYPELAPPPPPGFGRARTREELKSIAATYRAEIRTP